MNQAVESSRDRIVNAADHLFYIHGYNQTSFSDIANEAGVPRGNFYYYFKTKDDILQAVLDFRTDLVSQMLSNCDACSEDPHQQLLYLVEVLIREEENVIRYGCPMGTLNSELSKSSATLQQRAAGLFQQIRDWINSKLILLGFKDHADALALELLARLQGTTVIANVFHDREFLKKSVQQHRQWLDNKLRESV